MYNEKSVCEKDFTTFTDLSFDPKFVSTAIVVQAKV